MAVDLLIFVLPVLILFILAKTIGNEFEQNIIKPTTTALFVGLVSGFIIIKLPGKKASKILRIGFIVAVTYAALSSMLYLI